MQILNVTITNAFTDKKGYVTIKGDLGMTIEQYFEINCKLHPDSFVNFYWNDNKDFIFGQPLNMKLDEVLVDEGKMSFDDYVSKWFSETNGSILN